MRGYVRGGRVRVRDDGGHGWHSLDEDTLAVI